MSSAEEQQQPEAAAETTSAGGLLDAVLERMPKVVERDRGAELVNNLIEQALSGQVTYDKSVVHTLNRTIEELDKKLSKQLNAIMHHEKFQKLEGSWRGLFYLVDNTLTSKMLQLKVMNVDKRTLYKDFDRAVEFDQSHLFKQVYEGEFGIAGGEPLGAMIGDYEFTNHPTDMSLLTYISQVSAAAFCPFISAASPNLFGFESFQELSKPRDLERIFMDKSYIKWNAFRDTEDSRFVTLTMPRVLARMPYGSQTNPIDEFGYEEVELDEEGRSKPVEHDKYTWMNAAYALGTRLTESFALHGWCTSIRGRENGGTVEGLPSHIFVNDEGDYDLKCPTEIGITDRREGELSKLGFLSLCHYKNTDYAVFFGAQTTQKPKKYTNPDANANAEISARLPYMMATSRIAHYLKCIARDKIGSFMERSDCEKWLQRWIADYVCTDPNPSADMKAKYPLAEAQIKVEEVPGKPGEYNAVAHLRPWLQMEALTTSLRMVAKIPRQE